MSSGVMNFKDSFLSSLIRVSVRFELSGVDSRGGGTLRISGWGCAAGTLKPFTYTRASSAEFCYPILE